MLNFKSSQIWNDIFRWRSLYAVSGGLIFVFMSSPDIHPLLRIYLVMLEVQAATALIYFLSQTFKNNRNKNA
jgi:hypothetical protein